MKLALISDIHGNAIAFQSVLNQIDRDRVDQIICLGDAVATGPNPAECVGLLRQRKIPTIMGNADDWLLDPQRDPNASEFHQFIEEIDLWCRDQLSESDLDFIRSFQPTIEVKLSESHTLLAYHGSPRSYNEGIHPATTNETLAEFMPEPGITIMAGGHIHQPFIRRYRDLTVVNPGSIGLGYERHRVTNEPTNVGWAEYGVLEIDKNQPDTRGNLSIQLRRIPYDVSALKEATLTSGLPQAQRLADGWH